MNVGEYIKKLRIKSGYSQEQLGKLLGVQRAAVQKWECGKVQNLKRETIKRLSELFNVSPSTFIDSEAYLSDDIAFDIKNTYKVFAMNGKPGMHTTTADEGQLDKMAQLLEIASELPSEKIDMLIKMAESIK